MCAGVRNTVKCFSSVVIKRPSGCQASVCGCPILFRVDLSAKYSATTRLMTLSLEMQRDVSEGAEAEIVCMRVGEGGAEHRSYYY